jgi:hypothetical protein
MATAPPKEGGVQPDVSPLEVKMTDVQMIDVQMPKEAIASVVEQRKKAAADCMRSMGSRNRVRQKCDPAMDTRILLNQVPRGSGRARRILHAVVRRGHRRRAEVDISGAVIVAYRTRKHARKVSTITRGACHG